MPTHQQDVARFMGKFMPIPVTGCWIWTDHRAKNGYAKFGVQGAKVTAHRFSYQIHKGDIPEGMDVCHKCDVRDCVNPDHLFIGTRKDNMQDCSRKGRVKIPGLKGEEHPRSKLTEADVRAIRAASGTQRAIAKRFGVSQFCISEIRLGKAWKHVD